MSLPALPLDASRYGAGTELLTEAIAAFDGLSLARAKPVGTADWMLVPITALPLSVRAFDTGPRR
jgi:hypothetical protein